MSHVSPPVSTPRLQAPFTVTVIGVLLALLTLVPLAGGIAFLGIADFLDNFGLISDLLHDLRTFATIVGVVLLALAAAFAWTTYGFFALKHWAYTSALRVFVILIAFLVLPIVLGTGIATFQLIMIAICAGSVYFLLTDTALKVAFGRMLPPPAAPKPEEPLTWDMED